MISRDILNGYISKDRVPSFLCPRCGGGNLIPTANPESYQPGFSKRTNSEEWASWDDVSLRMSLVLRCGKDSCGEQFVLHATGGIEPDYDAGQDWTLVDYFRIRAVVPSPNLISLPKGLPDQIREHLEESFEVYWSHKTLAANCIRNGIEAFLTHFGIPSEVGEKWVSLGNRLQQYATSEPHHADFFKALKPFINAGSHGASVETETLLDIYEALELFLADVFDDRSRRFEELKKRLQNKGEDGPKKAKAF